MKVAFILDSFPLISETFIINQIVGLIDKHVDVTIFAEKDTRCARIHSNFHKYRLGDRTIYEPQWKGGVLQRAATLASSLLKVLTTKPLMLHRFFFLEGKFFNHRYLRAAIPLLKQNRFDIIHAHFGPLGVKATVLKELLSLEGEIICTFHGYDVDQREYRNNPGYYKALFNQAAYITVNSYYTFKRVASLGCADAKIKMLPVSLDTNIFHHKKARVQEDEVNIITIGRLVEFKGIEYSIKAVNELIKRGYNNLKYCIVGEGPLMSELSALIATLRIENHVSLVGSKTQEEIMIISESSDIFLLTGVTSSDGRQENQGLVIQEAQSLELPVVVSSIGGVPEGLIEGETGFLVPERDFIAAADKLELLITNRELRIKMGKKGREFVKTHFDTSVLTRRLIDLYTEVIRSRRVQS